MLKVSVNNSKELEIEVQKNELHYNGKQVVPDLVRLSENEYHLLLDNIGYRIQILERESDKKFVLSVNGKRINVDLKDKYDLLLQDLGMDVATGSKAQDIKAPMPGLVLEVLVENGQEVKKDTPLIILEAMKMENIIKAQGDGIIDSIKVKARDAVEKNQVLISFR